MPLLNNFVEEIKSKPYFSGDILEFGTGSGSSTFRIAALFNTDKIHTFDGFIGLPKTEKGIPKGTNWWVGQYRYDEQTTRNRLSQFNNVNVYKYMTWELKEPHEYDIIKISGVNIDVDLYEGTLDTLHFMDKCVWDTVLVRFDDWGCATDGSQIAEEVDAHEKAAFYNFIEEKGYRYEFYDSLTESTNGTQSIVRIWRKK